MVRLEESCATYCRVKTRTTNRPLMRKKKRQVVLRSSISSPWIFFSFSGSFSRGSRYLSISSSQNRLSLPSSSATCPTSRSSVHFCTGAARGCDEDPAMQWRKTDTCRSSLLGKRELYVSNASSFPLSGFAPRKKLSND